MCHFIYQVKDLIQRHQRGICIRGIVGGILRQLFGLSPPLPF